MYDKLINDLNKMMVDSCKFSAELNKAVEDEHMIQLVDKIRTDIIAIVFYRTAIDVKDRGLGKGWKFHRTFKIIDEMRVIKCTKAAEANAEVAEAKAEVAEATTRTGVKIFTSVTEMIGRIMQLLSSKEAGNVGVEIDNELIYILDHLRSENVLTSDEYEIVHRDLIAATQFYEKYNK